MATPAVIPATAGRPRTDRGHLRLPDVDEHQIQRDLLLLGAAAVVLMSAGRTLAGPRRPRPPGTPGASTTPSWKAPR